MTAADKRPTVRIYLRIEFFITPTPGWNVRKQLKSSIGLCQGCVLIPSSVWHDDFRWSVLPRRFFRVTAARSSAVAVIIDQQHPHNCAGFLSSYMPNAPFVHLGGLRDVNSFRAYLTKLHIHLP